MSRPHGAAPPIARSAAPAFSNADSQREAAEICSMLANHPELLDDEAKPPVSDITNNSAQPKVTSFVSSSVGLAAREQQHVEERRIFEAQVTNLRAKIHTLERQNEQLMKDVSDAKRGALSIPPSKRQTEVDVLSDRIKFLEHELRMAQQRAVAAAPVAQAVAAPSPAGAGVAVMAAASLNGTIVKREDKKRGRSSATFPATSSAASSSNGGNGASASKKQAKEETVAAAVAVKVEAGTADAAAANDNSFQVPLPPKPMFHERAQTETDGLVLVRKLHCTEDVFRLLQMQEIDFASVSGGGMGSAGPSSPHGGAGSATARELLELTRRLTVRLSVLSAHDGAVDGLVFSLAELLKLELNDAILCSVLNVLRTVFATVPSARAGMSEAMCNCSWRGGVALHTPSDVVGVAEGVGAAVDGAAGGGGGGRSEAETPWAALLSALVQDLCQRAPSISSEAVSCLISCIQSLCFGVSLEGLKAFSPLLGGRGILIHLLNRHKPCSLALRTQALDLLAALLRNPALYRKARFAGEDRTSVLRHAALLMQMEVTNEDDGLLALRRSIVRLFSSIVAAYPDWDSCANEPAAEEPAAGNHTATNKEDAVPQTSAPIALVSTPAAPTGGGDHAEKPTSPASVVGSGGGGGRRLMPQNSSGGGDFGPRLVSLFYELVQQMRLCQKQGCSREKLDSVAEVVYEAFALLVECSNYASVEASLFSKMFRPLYVSALVALSSTLHPKLAKCKAHAELLLEQVQSKL